MKILCLSAFFCLLAIQVSAQDISGKWYGKITQASGGFSELYDIQLDIYQKKSISGESISTLANAIDIRMGFWGTLDGDSIRLQESKLLLRAQVVVPLDYQACVKNINVAYRKVGAREYLQGSWNGVGIEDTSQICLPGTVILARTKEDIKYFTDSIHSEILKPVETTAAPVDFAPKFLNTGIYKAQEIEVKNLSIKLQVRDYLNVDNDTVSIYLNRAALTRNVPLTRRSKTFNVRLNKSLPLNELVIYAENLGRIPPNTSEMFVIDGNKTYRLLIESDKQKSAAIYLRYKP